MKNALLFIKNVFSLFITFTSKITIGWKVNVLWWNKNFHLSRLLIKITFLSTEVGIQSISVSLIKLYELLQVVLFALISKKAIEFQSKIILKTVNLFLNNIYSFIKMRIDRNLPLNVRYVNWSIIRYVNLMKKIYH